MLRKLFFGLLFFAFLANGASRALSATPSALLEIEARERATVNNAFPGLRNRFQILGESTRGYNCIAWSLGITTKWVWPGDTVSDFDRLNAKFGYRRLELLDLNPVNGIEKIVLYGKYTNGRLVMTHQARQLRDGSWTSKLGALPIIRHQNADAFDNDTYGHPVAVYVRRLEQKEESFFGFSSK